MRETALVNDLSVNSVVPVRKNGRHSAEGHAVASLGMKMRERSHVFLDEEEMHQLAVILYQRTPRIPAVSLEPGCVPAMSPCRIFDRDAHPAPVCHLRTGSPRLVNLVGC